MAFYDLETDRLYGRFTTRKRWTEFLPFLKWVRSRYPREVGDVVADCHAVAGERDLDELDGIVIELAQLLRNVLEPIRLARIVGRAEKDEPFLELVMRWK